VPAGNDTYPPDQVGRTLGRLLEAAGTDTDAVIRLARTHPDDQASRSASPSSRCARAAWPTA
jgi:hypothetical protein